MKSQCATPQITIPCLQTLVGHFVLLDKARLMRQPHSLRHASAVGVDKALPRNREPGGEYWRMGWNKKIGQTLRLSGPKFFPQVKVVRFYVPPPPSPSAAGPQLQHSGPRRSWSQCRTQQAQDQSGPRRTSTASSWSQWSLPDPNSNLWIQVIPAGPRPQRISKETDRMPEKCQRYAR